MNGFDHNTNSSVHDKNICKIPKKDSTYIYLRSSYTLLLLYTAIIQTTLQHSISKYSNSIHTQDEIDTVVLIGPVCVYLRRGKTSSFLQQNIHGKNLRQAAKTFFFFGIDSSKQASTVG